MTTILDLDNKVMGRVLSYFSRVDKWGTHYWQANRLSSVPLTCRAWVDLGRDALAKKHVEKRRYHHALADVRIWTRTTFPAFECLSWTTTPDHFELASKTEETPKDLNAVDKPGTVAYFAHAIFEYGKKLDSCALFGVCGVGGAFENAKDCKDLREPRVQIRDQEAMSTFLHIVEDDMIQLMQKALQYVHMIANSQDKSEDTLIVSGNDLHNAVKTADHSKQNVSAFVCNYNTPPDVGVSLDAQLRIVAGLAHRASIVKFDGYFTKLAWCILVNRAAQLLNFGSMIATSGLQPNGHAPQFDDDDLPDSGGPSKEFDCDSADESDSDYEPEERDEEESDSDSGYGTTNDSSDDEDEDDWVSDLKDDWDDGTWIRDKKLDMYVKKPKRASRDMVDVAKERAAKRRRTCRFDPVLHDGENIPHEWHFKARYYVISPSAKCFRWAYEHM